jgi:hypothetical protein
VFFYCIIGFFINQYVAKQNVGNHFFIATKTHGFVCTIMLWLLFNSGWYLLHKFKKIDRFTGWIRKNWNRWPHWFDKRNGSSPPPNQEKPDEQRSDRRFTSVVVQTGNTFLLYSVYTVELEKGMDSCLCCMRNCFLINCFAQLVMTMQSRYLSFAIWYGKFAKLLSYCWLLYYLVMRITIPNFMSEIFLHI